MATIINDRDVLIQATSPRFTIPTTRAILLSATASTFNVNLAGVSSPTSVTFTATLLGMTGTPTYACSGGTLTSVSGNNATLTYANQSSNSAVVTVTFIQDSVTYTDKITVTKIFTAVATGNLVGQITETQITDDSISTPKLQALAVTANKINSNGLTIKDLSGNIILGSGSALDWTKLTAAGTVGASGILNSSISIASNGVLSGGGGGSVSLSGLGYAGTLDATTNNGAFANLVGTITSGNAATYFAANSIAGTYISDLVASKITAGTLTAGVVYAGSITASQITAGTLTGFTIQTASSGQRIAINESGNNRFKVYDGASTLLEIGGSSGTLYIPIGSTISPAVYVISASGSSIPTIFGNNTSSGQGVRGDSSSGEGVLGFSSTGFGGSFSSAGSSPGIYSKNISSGHGARIQGGAGSITASAVIGLSDGTSRCFYNETGTFGPFTGMHDGLLSKDAIVEDGDILVDTVCMERNGISDTIFLQVVSSTPYQKAAVGVANVRLPLDQVHIPAAYIDRDATNIASLDGNSEPVPKESWYDIMYVYDYIGLNSLGEGQINVCGENGDIEAGDFIVTSSILGKGMKQDDDILHNYTVARSRESMTFSSPSEIKQIACIYLCG